MRRLSAALFVLLGCSSTVVTAGDAATDVVRTDTQLTDVPAVDVPAVDVRAMDVPTVDVPTTRRVPLRHRASAMACPTERPPSTCEAGGGPASTCTSDGQCTMGVNGRCVGNPRDGCRCNYDLCTTDSNCSTGGPCECRLPGRGASGANVCMSGNCQVDANCGAEGYCSPSLGSCGDYGGTVGYFCHTPADECIDDADCAGDAGFLGQRPYCMFAREVGRWVCSNQGCAG